MKYLLHALSALLFYGGCSVFSPSAYEGEGVGSNTNWFRSCDMDSECGQDLGCICGTCTKPCTADAECGDNGSGICPVDRGVFQLSCEPQVSLALAGSVCAPSCVMDDDCPSGQLCVSGACGGARLTLCEQVTRVEIRASSTELRARVGGLFGDQFYLPQWYAGMPLDWEEPYSPSTLSVLLTDAAGAPVSGCEVAFAPEESSGYAYAEDPVSDAAGEVTALWVAGTAPEQILRVAVLGADSEWIFDTMGGEARPHDQAPFAPEPEGRDYTSPSGLVVEPEVSLPSDEVRVSMTPLTFPAGISYVVLDTNALSIEYTNAGAQDPGQNALPPDERILDLRIARWDGVDGRVVAIQTTGFCSADSLGLWCSFPDAWQPGETIEVRVEARYLEPGEAPSDYDPQTHYQGPCEGPSGCTDYAIYTQRSGEEAQRQAVLRAAIGDDFSAREINISGVYTPELGIAPSCLQTERAAVMVKHETLHEGEWIQSAAGVSWAFHETWQDQICSNYAAFATADGYYLSTGGPSPVSTPTLPGAAHQL